MRRALDIALDIAFAFLTGLLLIPIAIAHRKDLQ